MRSWLSGRSDSTIRMPTQNELRTFMLARRIASLDCGDWTQVSRHLPSLWSVIVDGSHLLQQCRSEDAVREILGFKVGRRPDNMPMQTGGPSGRR